MPKLNQIWPNLINVGQIWSTLPKFDQNCSKELTKIYQIWLNLPNLTKFDQIWPNLTKIWPKFDQNLTTVDQIWPKLTKFDWVPPFTLPPFPRYKRSLPLPCHLFQDTKGASLYLTTFSSFMMKCHETFHQQNNQNFWFCVIKWHKRIGYLLLQFLLDAAIADLSVVLRWSSVT